MSSPNSHPLFRRANFQIDSKTESSDLIRTLPELVEFNATYNPQHLFCLQANKAGEATRISHLELKYAVLRCSAWLRDKVPGLKGPEKGEDGKVSRGPPIALLMESDIGIFIYLLSLLSIGVPVSIASILDPSSLM